MVSWCARDAYRRPARRAMEMTDDDEMLALMLHAEELERQALELDDAVFALSLALADTPSEGNARALALPGPDDGDAAPDDDDSDDASKWTIVDVATDADDDGQRGGSDPWLSSDASSRSSSAGTTTAENTTLAVVLVEEKPLAVPEDRLDPDVATDLALSLLAAEDRYLALEEGMRHARQAAQCVADAAVARRFAETGTLPEVVLPEVIQPRLLAPASADDTARRAREAKAPIRLEPPVEENVFCVVCKDATPASACERPKLPRDANEDVASGSGSEPKPCPHAVCRDCLPTWMTSEIASREPFVRCASFHDCDALFTAEQCDDALGAESDARRLLASLQTPEALGLRSGALFYCPHGRCNRVLDTRGETEGRCPGCDGDFCRKCKVPYHVGASCEEFQALPEDLKSPEDVALLRVALEEGLRRCPRCGAMVDKTKDTCAHVRCRCGHAFCYACGEGYVHLAPTAENAHGRAKCGCGLWRRSEPHASVVGAARTRR